MSSVKGQGPTGKKSKKKAISRRKRNSSMEKLANASWDPVYSARFMCVGPPDKLRMTFKYVQSFNLSGSAAPAAQVFRVNSCYDPDLTGAGGQPLYWDQFAVPVYEVYVVLGFEAEIEIFNNSTTETAYLAACYSDVNNSALSVENLTEAKYSRKVMVPFAPIGGAQKNMVMPYLTSSQLQGQKEIESDPNMYANVTTNPVDTLFLIIKAGALDGSTSINLTVRATLYYDTVLKGLQIPSES